MTNSTFIKYNCTHHRWSQHLPYGAEYNYIFTFWNWHLTVHGGLFLCYPLVSTHSCWEYTRVMRWWFFANFTSAWQRPEQYCLSHHFKHSFLRNSTGEYVQEDYDVLTIPDEAISNTVFDFSWGIAAIFMNFEAEYLVFTAY